MRRTPESGRPGRCVIVLVLRPPILHKNIGCVMHFRMILLANFISHVLLQMPSYPWRHDQSYPQPIRTHACHATQRLLWRELMAPTPQWRQCPVEPRSSLAMPWCPASQCFWSAWRRWEIDRKTALEQKFYKERRYLFEILGFRNISKGILYLYWPQSAHLWSLKNMENISFYVYIDKFAVFLFFEY